ncbi:diguanylate cyclase [Liberiplasma polymorphum]|uniref:GGDEF domain-containing protein n=1 Tax=Liberiplasma polymorphum TaxID=3374570 RepID=UPI00377381B8
MKYDDYSREELISKIRSMEKTEKKEVEKSNNLIRLQYLTSGYLGPWHWNAEKDTITLNSMQQKVFKINSLKQLSFDGFMTIVHKTDKELVKDSFAKLVNGDISVVEIEYQLLFEDGKYHLLYHRAETDETNELNQTIGILGVIIDITEKRQKDESLNRELDEHKKHATLDFLTNLLNRRGLHAQTSRFLQGTHSINMPISIAMFDIDNFKQVNDKYGHEYGDQILIEIANLLRENTRSEDIVSRFGGDEFILVLINKKIMEAYDVCERIRLAVEGKYQKFDIKITLSGGVKEFQEEDISDTIRKVDALLYKAKSNSKNRILK